MSYCELDGLDGGVIWRMLKGGWVSGWVGGRTYQGMVG